MIYPCTAIFKERELTVVVLETQTKSRLNERERQRKGKISRIGYVNMLCYAMLCYAYLESLRSNFPKRSSTSSKPRVDPIRAAIYPILRSLKPNQHPLRLL